MARDGIWLSLIHAALLLSLMATGLGQGAPPSKPLGQVVSASAEIDGRVVPSGTTLMSGNVVQTRENTASLHLTGRPVIQLGLNSRAKAEATPAGAIKITVESGTLSMRTASGQAITVPATRLLYFPQQSGDAQQVPSEHDVIALLEVPAAAGSTSITVADASKIDASQPILIRRRGAELGELHYIRSIRDHVLTLTAPLSAQFPAQSEVLQGESTRALLTEPGVPARPQPGIVTRPGRRSNTPLIVLLSAAGAGAAAAVLLYDGNESTSASPSRP
jgi:hypothetical protein